MRKINFGKNIFLIIMGIALSGCVANSNTTVENNKTNTPIETTEQTTPATIESQDDNIDKTAILKDVMMAKLEFGVEEYKGFYCVDVDRDNENEIVLLYNYTNGTRYDYLDCVGEDVHIVNFENSIEKELVLNQKGNFQFIEYYNDKIVSVSIIEGNTENRLFQNYNIFYYNGEIISGEEGEHLVKTSVAQPAVLYEITEANIEQHINTKVQAVEEICLELISDEDVLEINKDLSLMQKAVLGQVEVYDTEDGKMKNVTELPNYYPSIEFHYCDLDGDGVKEVVLRFAELSILHEIDGVVYRYEESYRAMLPLYEDGTMNSTAGAAHNELNKIKEFTKLGKSEEIIFYNIDGIMYKEYNYNGKCIELTGEEYAEIKSKYKEIPAKNYEYSVSNVINVIK